MDHLPRVQETCLLVPPLLFTNTFSCLDLSSQIRALESPGRPLSGSELPQFLDSTSPSSQDYLLVCVEAQRGQESCSLTSAFPSCLWVATNSPELFHGLRVMMCPWFSSLTALESPGGLVKTQSAPPPTAPVPDSKGWERAFLANSQAVLVLLIRPPLLEDHG